MKKEGSGRESDECSGKAVHRTVRQAKAGEGLKKSDEKLAVIDHLGNQWVSTENKY